MRNERILYLDGWNVLLATNAVGNLVDYNSNPITMYLGTANVLRTVIEKFKPAKVFFVLDGPEAGQRRRQLFPEYKGKRRTKARTSKVTIMEGDDNMVYGGEGEFQNQLIKLYELLKLLPVTILSVPFCEADDMISYLALKNKDKFENIIVSNDRDYLQLIQEGIMVYRWRAKQLYDSQTFLDEFKIRPKDYIFKKVLIGDTSDQIDGLKGMGEKTFLNVAPVLSAVDLKNIDEFISFFESYDLTTLSTRASNSIKKALVEKDKMQLAYQIMKLDESCMRLHHIDTLRIQIEEQLDKTFSRFTCRVKLQKDQFNKLYNGFNEEKWLQPFSFLKINFEVAS